MKIKVELILGHRAIIREDETPEGHTHDWEVYVESEEGNMEAYVNRIVFNLHESYPNPRRVLRIPPYVLKETGYAGFIIGIEVFFKTSEEPRKAVFDYEMYLQSCGPQINPSRKQRLIFNFPSEEFAENLLEGGGTLLQHNLEQ